MSTVSIKNSSNVKIKSASAVVFSMGRGRRFLLKRLTVGILFLDVLFPQCAVE
jgi:hypothetical protein